MGTTRYLINSNAVSYYLAGRLPANGMSFMHPVIDTIPNISVITRIELVGFVSSDAVLIEDFVANSIVYDLSEAIILQTIDLRKRGRIKLPDAVIAATALVHDLKLLTRNESDFSGIKGLSLINPHRF